MRAETKEAGTKALEQPMNEAAPIEVRPAQLSDLALAADVVLDNPNADAEAMQQRFQRRQQLIRLCFQMTSPHQWVKFEDQRSGKATVYPMGGAADAIIRHILACTWQEKEVVVETDTKGEPIRAKASAWLCAMDGRKVERFEGYREMGGFIKTKPDLIKGAFENLKSVAVRDLLGLRGRSPEELAALGLDLAQTGTATFANNKAGAGSSVTVPFGNLKGIEITDPRVTLKDLEWLANKAKESLADPSKGKWHKAEQQRLDAYRAEAKRRSDEAKVPPVSTDPNAAPPQEWEPGAGG